jgi:hypothetical protein
VREDLDWLPRELKRRRWTTTAACWVGATTLATAATVVSGGALAHLGVLLAAGGIVAGGRLGRSRMLQQLEQLGHGSLDLVRLGAEPEGRLVHVSGRVSAQTTLPSFLHGVPAVYRRMTFRLGGTRFIHEAGVDFDLVDAAGVRLKVQVAGARLFVPPPAELADYPATLFTESALTRSLVYALGRNATREVQVVPSAEVLLRPDTNLDVIGYKTEAVDPSIGSGIGRSLPMRVALRAGRIPVILTPRPSL